MSEMKFAYVAHEPGTEGYYAASCDMPSRREEIAEFAAKHIRQGSIVSRVPLEAAQAGMRQYMDWKDKRETPHD